MNIRIINISIKISQNYIGKHNNANIVASMESVMKSLFTNVVKHSIEVRLQCAVEQLCPSVLCCVPCVV